VPAPADADRLGEAVADPVDDDQDEEQLRDSVASNRNDIVRSSA
jgi:hypothetical protein